VTVGDWDRRQLCPDGACIGVIGPDGLCKTCGRAAQGWGDERKRGLVADAAGDDDELDEDEDFDDEDDDDHEDGDAYDDSDVDNDAFDANEPIDPIDPSAPAALGTLAEWADRQLCIDGACIGLLGDDGTCKVCGKAGSKAKPTAASAKPAPAKPAPAKPARESDDAALEAAAREMASSAEPGEVESIAPLVAEDLEARKLCPDGGCVGVIGADGRCKVCGKEAA